MGRPIFAGSTNQSVVIRIIDSTDGTPETGVTSATTGLDIWYRREGGLQVSLTENDNLSSLAEAHDDGAILHIDDGYYRVDVPDAAFAANANGVLVGGGATGMVVIGDYFPIWAINPYVACLPNAAADAAGGLIISDAGGQDVDAAFTSIAAIETDTGTTLDNLVDDLESRLGTPGDLGGGATVAQNLADIAGATFSTATDSNEAIRNHIGDGTNLTEAGGDGDHLTEAGGTGDHLGDLGGMSTAMKAEVNAEADTALSDYDPPTHAELISEINDVQTDIAALENLSAAEVNAEVVDVLFVDATTEPTGVPASTAAIAAKMSWNFAGARNKITQTATTQTIRNDADSADIGAASVSDDGTTFTRAEFA